MMRTDSCLVEKNASQRFIDAKAKDFNIFSSIDSGGFEKNLF